MGFDNSNMYCVKGEISDGKSPVSVVWKWEVEMFWGDELDDIHVLLIKYDILQMILD